MSLRGKDSITRKSAASQRTRSAGFALLPQLEANRDGAASGSSGGVSPRGSPLIESQGGEGEHLMRKDEDGERPMVYMDMRTHTHEKAQAQESWFSSPAEPLLRSSVTILEKPLPKTPYSLVSRVSRISMDSWAWEFACWLLSIACLIAIIIILRVYDGEALPQWDLGITLNAMVSVFASIAKAALLFPVTECISQLKWVWFATESRKLQDFEMFDNASKGLWGSILLLCTPKTRYVMFVKLTYIEANLL